MKPTTIFLAISVLFLSSCTDMNKAQQGAAGGTAGEAQVGQALGHNIETTLIGTAVGTMLGYIVGKEMDKYDRQQLNHVYERGMSGRSSAWINPDTDNQFQVIPRPAYSNHANNKICREAEIIAVIDGKQAKTYTTACRNQHGSWQLQN